MSTRTDTTTAAVPAITQRAPAIVLAEMASGPLTLAATDLYALPTAQAWEYLQDMHFLAVGEEPRFASRSDFPFGPEEAFVHYSNGVASVFGDMLGVDLAANLTMFDSLVEFVSTHESLDGLEGIFLSGAMTALDTGRSDLLDHAAQAWQIAGGIPEILGGGLDASAVLNVATAEFGLPSVDAILNALGDVDAFIENPTGAASNLIGGVGHRLFDRVQSLAGTIDASAGASLEEFRESDVGHFVESVLSIGIGVSIFAGVPAVRAAVRVVKVAVDVVEAGIGLLSSVVDFLFGSDDDRTPPRDAGGDKVRDGSHVVVGAQSKGQSRRSASNDGRPGLCPDPDLGLPPGLARPDRAGGLWPTLPVPTFDGPGCDGFFNVDGTGHVGLHPMIGPESALGMEFWEALDYRPLRDMVRAWNLRTPANADLFNSTIYRVPLGETDSIDVAPVVDGNDVLVLLGWRESDTYSKVSRFEFAGDGISRTVLDDPLAMFARVRDDHAPYQLEAGAMVVRHYSTFNAAHYGMTTDLAPLVTVGF